MASSVWDSVIFNYLNNNAHKFDEHGNFDPTPDWRDYAPFGGVTHPNGGYGKRPKINKPKYAGKYKLGEGPDDLAKRQMKYYAEDYANNIRYDKNKCEELKELEKGLCYDGYKGWPLQACLTRVDDRNKFCRDDGHFNSAPPIWTAELVSGQPLGDEDPDKRRKSKSKQEPQPQPGPEPQEKPDKSKFSLGSMFTNALTTALAMNPGFVMAVDPSGSKMNSILNNFVLLPSDYPKGMRPLSKWSPTPATSAAVSMLPVPIGGAAAFRVPSLPPR
jgi:hypothetical protein